MIIRNLIDDEYKKSIVIDSVAFEFPIDYEKLKEEKENKYTPKEVDGFKEVTIGAFSDDEKTLYTKINSKPYKINFDGKKVLMSGIGGVSTLPPYRRNGAVRACFINLFNSLKEKQIPFSYLYPFSCSYYRNFGYENISPINIWTIDFKAYKKFDVGGYTEFLMPDDSIEDNLDIYHKMFGKYNLSIIRTQKDFEHFEKRDTFNQKRYAYIYKNDDGVPKAYILLKKMEENGKNIMDCCRNFGNDNDFAFADIEGLCGLLNFAQTFAANYDAIRFTLPNDIQIQSLISENNACSIDTKYMGMVRVIDVAQVLKLAKYKGAGNVKLKITDKYCEWNNAVFNVSFDENNVNVDTSSEEFDVSMDISTFSTLITGSFNSIYDCLKVDINIVNDNEDFEKIFYYKPNRVADIF